MYLAMDREDLVLDATVWNRQDGDIVRLSDGITHYRWDGSPTGQVVVLLHGGTIPSWEWDPVVPYLAGAGLRVLRYDMFGRGFSDRPTVTYNRDLFCSQLLELLVRLGVVQPVDLVGTSFGGMLTDFLCAQSQLAPALKTQ